MGKKTINWPTGNEIIKRMGSIIHWDTFALIPYKNRTRRTVFVTCGKCKKKRRVPIFSIKKFIESTKWNYTGYCSSCRTGMTWAERYGRNKRKEGTKYIEPIRGYTLIYYPNHPMAHKNGYLFEHRYVMSQKLGRILKSFEHVHHKNGNKSDNRPENLELLPNNEHQTIRFMKNRIEHLESILTKHNIPF